MFTAASFKRLSPDSLAATDGRKSPVNRPFLHGPGVFLSGRLFTESNDQLRFRVLPGKRASFENRLNGRVANRQRSDYSARPNTLKSIKKVNVDPIGRIRRANDESRTSDPVSESEKPDPLKGRALLGPIRKMKHPAFPTILPCGETDSYRIPRSRSVSPVQTRISLARSCPGVPASGCSHEQTIFPPLGPAQ